MEEQTYFYEVEYKTINGYRIIYCRTEKDIIDIINSPEYGKIRSITTIHIPPKDYYEYNGVE